jgi:hypothetical protein
MIRQRDGRAAATVLSRAKCCTPMVLTPGQRLAADTDGRIIFSWRLVMAPSLLRRSIRHAVPA